MAPKARWTSRVATPSRTGCATSRRSASVVAGRSAGVVIVASWVEGEGAVGGIVAVVVDALGAVGAAAVPQPAVDGVDDVGQRHGDDQVEEPGEQQRRLVAGVGRRVLPDPEQVRWLASSPRK